VEFELTEEQKRFQKIAHEYFEKELAPIVVELEKKDNFPLDFFKKIGRDGFLGINLPKKYGGREADTITCCLLMEEVSYICPGVAVCIFTTTMVSPLSILAVGSEKQKEKYLRALAGGESILTLCFTEPDAGSDNLNIRTTAEKSGDYYIINGNKIFITNGTVGDVHLIVAYTDRSKGGRGLSLFLVDGHPPEIDISRKLDKLGWHTSDTVELAINNLKVHKEQMLGPEGIGLSKTLDTISFGRMMMAASALGIAQGTYDECVKFCNERMVNGSPLTKLQSIRHQLVNMYIDIEMNRLMIYKTAWKRDKGLRHRKESSIVKYYAGTLARRITMEAVQLLGENAFTDHDSLVARHFRDAPVYTLADGTSEIQQEIISREMGFVDKKEIRL
jgi:butyryl-CoA dehydrogenase